MDTTNESLFQIMRFNILNEGRKGIKASPFSSAYIYAWESGVFPSYNDGADWHKPFPEQFRISDEEVTELGSLLDEKWLEKTPLTFYELEDRFGISGSTHSSGNWERGKLLVACRYMYLNKMFDDSFWSALVESGKSPVEAGSINKPFTESDIYFM